MTENLSIGTGFNIQYLQSKLTNALDLGTVCVQALGSTACANRALHPQQADGHLESAFLIINHQYETQVMARYVFLIVTATG